MHDILEQVFGNLACVREEETVEDDVESCGIRITHVKRTMETGAPRAPA